MKLLLTGATGFVGSHILDRLCAQGWSVRLLIRQSSPRSFIEPHLGQVELHEGTLDDPDGLRTAMRDITHLIHCAGATRAKRAADFYRINHHGTRHVVEAANACAGQLQRFLHISSLAVSHPAPAGQPAREEDPSAPVSEYGKSKWAAEQEVRTRCKVPFTVLRPPGVYGPRDDGFLGLFKVAKWHVIPRFLGGIEALSLVFAKDLAEAVVTCLTHPAAAGRTYFVASPELVTVPGFCQEVARQLGIWTVPVWVPVPLLGPFCVLSEWACKLQDKPSLVNRQKYAELRAPGWVCDVSRIRDEVGFVAQTPLAEGIRQAIQWYREQHWL